MMKYHAVLINENIGYTYKTLVKFKLSIAIMQRYKCVNIKLWNINTYRYLRKRTVYRKIIIIVTQTYARDGH